MYTFSVLSQLASPRGVKITKLEHIFHVLMFPFLFFPFRFCKNQSWIQVASDILFDE